jgi:hypothetical protein
VLNASAALTKSMHDHQVEADVRERAKSSSISPFIFAQASLQSGDAAAGPSGPAALAFDRLVGWPAYPCVFKMIYIAPCVFVSFGQCG